MRRLILIVFAWMACLTVAAVPALRRRIVLTQPDGTLLQAVISGDERAHAVTDLQGHVLIQDSDKWWHYAAFRGDGSRYRSGYLAGRPAPTEVLSASFAPAQMWQAAPAAMTGFRVEGEEGSADPTGPVHRKCLILLAQFPDGEMKHTREDFERLIRERGYSQDGATGSMADYFEEQFRGDWTFTFEVSEIFTFDEPSSAYFSNDSRGNDDHPRSAVTELCQKAVDAGIDLAEYDGDGDGEVDNIFIIVAGKSEADGGDEDCVWPHMAYLQGDPAYHDATFGGVQVNRYTISTELQRLESGRFVLTGIGTLCHEYSHTFGLMDLYDVDYAGSGGLSSGMWRTTALMDAGNYNNAGRTPPHFNAVDYDHLGLGQVEELQEGAYVLEPISENRRYLRYETGVEGEYFLLECREARGWDAYIGGSGLLIYQVDRTSRSTGHSDSKGADVTADWRWRMNEVNCRPDHPCARLVSATPGIRAYNSAQEFQYNQSQLFYPAGEYAAFTALTTPAFIFWDGTESPLAITEITRDGNKVRFTVSKMTDVVVPEVAGVESFIFQDAAILRWAADTEGYSGHAYVSWGQAGTDGKELEIEPYAPGKYAVTLEGLTPGKAYRAVLSFRTSGISSKQVPVNFTTKYRYATSLPFIYVKSLTVGTDGTVPAGSVLPLRVYNLDKAVKVSWTFNGRPITPEGDGFYRLTRSGTLKATVEYQDGSQENIIKEITVK